MQFEALMLRTLATLGTLACALVFGAMLLAPMPAPSTGSHDLAGPVHTTAVAASKLPSGVTGCLRTAG